MNDKKLIIIGLMFLLLVQSGFAINTFVIPTPDNATITSNNTFYINVSIIDNNVTSAKFIWNSSNMTTPIYGIIKNESSVLNYNSPNLVLAMNFDNISSIGENQTHIVDLSNGGNNATYFGQAQPNSTGKFGSSFYSHGDAINDYASVAYNTNLDFGTGDFAFSAWINPALYVYDFPSIFSAHDSIHNDAYIFGVDRSTNTSEAVPFLYGGNNGISNYGNTVIHLNTWTHLVATRHNGVLTFYVNGVKDKTITEAGQFNTYAASATKIGRQAAGGQDRGWYGHIDDLRIWNKSLSSAEVSNLYSATLSRINQTDWLFNSNPINIDDGVYTYESCATGTIIENCTNYRQITIDTTPPTVTSILPSDQLETNKVNFNFTGNATDINGINTSTFYLYNSSNYLINTSNISYPPSIFFSNLNNSVFNLIDGVYTWFYKAMDVVGNVGYSSNRTFRVDTINPIVTLNSPNDLFGRDKGIQQFNCSITNVQTHSLELYIWNSSNSVIYQNQTNVSGPYNSTLWDYNFTKYGIYHWNCLGTDAVNLTDWGQSNRTIFVPGPGSNSCGNLNKSNTQYNLTTNVTSFGTCFNILSENITLNCNNYAINYGTYGSGYGINNSGSNKNFKILDCQIHNANKTINSQNMYGIYSNGYNTTIYNNTIVNGGNESNYGLYSTLFSTIQHNIIIINENGTSNHGMLLNGAGSIITNNTINIINSTSSRGMSLGGSGDGMVISSNTITSGGHFSNTGILLGIKNAVVSNNFIDMNISFGNGIYSLGINNKIFNNTILVDGSSVNGYGAQLYMNNNFTGNTVNITGTEQQGYGVYMANQNNITVEKNSISTSAGSSSNAIACVTVHDVTIRGNVLSTNGFSSNNDAISLTSCDNFTISNNTINTNGTGSDVGIRLLSGDDNINIENNTITTKSINSISIFFQTASMTFVNITNNLFNTAANNEDIKFNTAGVSNIFLDNQAVGKYSFKETNNVSIINSFGRIDYLSLNSSGNNLSSDIVIKDNLVYTNSSKIGLNSSANITLYNIGERGFTSPTIIENGITDCISSGKCYNFTALNATNVIFNVTGWSNFTIGDITNSPPTLSSVILNTTSPNNYTTDNLTGYPQSISDVDGDNVTLVYNWYKQNSTNNYAVGKSVFINDNSLVSYWPFNNDTLDYKGSNDGVNNGAILNSSGIIGGSYGFNDVNSNTITFADSPAWDFGANNFTISLWVKGTGNDLDGLLVRDSSLPTPPFQLLSNNGVSWNFWATSNGITWDVVNSAVVANASPDWTHLVITRNGSTFRFYGNGNLTSTATSSSAILSSSAALTIGLYNSINYLTATIDEFQIYNRSLSDSEIKQLYYGSVYSGNVMNSSQTTIGDNWTLGVVPLDYLNVGNEVNSSEIQILQFIDTTPPYFTTIPANMTINYTQGFGVDFNATDETLFDSYSINWTTHFSINQSGFLQNTTQLASGTYLINVTINDTSNNINSTIYQVVVNQIASLVNLTLNNSEGNISINNGATIDLNCTQVTGDSGNTLQLYNNGTLINSGISPIGNTTTFSTDGLFNITCDYPNTQNYTASSKTYWVSVTTPVNTSLTINFTNPTPANGTQTNNASIIANVSITNANNLVETTFDWNGTNETIISVASTNVTANFTINLLNNFTFNNGTGLTTFYDDSLVLMYGFNNISSLGENSTYAVDYSKYSNNGTAKNGAFPVSNGKYGGAFQFDGINDYVNCGNDTSLNWDSSDGAVGAWVKTTNDYTGSFGTLLINGVGGAGGKRYFLMISGAAGEENKPRFDIDDDVTPGSVVGDNTINDGLWHHIVGVRTASQIRLYVDGVISSTSPVGAGNKNLNSIEPCTIGASNNVGAQGVKFFFNGVIDEVRVWNRSLSASEIQQQYSSNLKKYDVDKWLFITNKSGNYSLTYILKGSRNDTISFNKINSNTYNLLVNKTNLDYANYTYQSCVTEGVPNWQCTELRSLLATPDTTFPIWYNNKTNLTSSTSVGEQVYFNVIFNDTNPDSYIFSWYNGTIWSNDTSTSYLNAQEISVIKTITASGGQSINWTWYFNDTSGNNNQTDVWSVALAVTSITPPSIKFINPTPANGSQITDTSFIVNVSVSEANLTSITYNFNGTNYSIYNDSLIGMWNYDNISSLGENSTNVVDLSSRGFNGTVMGNATYSVDGRYGGEYQFDGVDDYITMGSGFSSDQQGTISAWIKPKSENNNYVLATGGAAAANFGLLGLRIYSPAADVHIGFATRPEGDSSFDIVEGSTNLNIDGNTWYYVTVTSDGSTWELYVNGEKETLSTLAGVNKGEWFGDINIASGEETTVGLRKSNGNYLGFFNGTIDEVRVWNRTLSQQEITQQYMSNLHKHNTTQWYLSVNESKNSTSGLDNGNYTYQAFAKNKLGNQNSTEIRTIEIANLNDFQGPTINDIILPATVNPLEGGIRTIYIQFNATDASGLNDNTANIVLNNSGTIINSNSCANISQSGFTKKYNCSIDFNYYDPSGIWDVNVSIKDLYNNYAENLTQNYTYGTLSAMTMAPDAISFGTTLKIMDTNILAVDDPVVLNNTGNQNFSTINITASDLIGQTWGTDILPAGNFTVNTIDACNGNVLKNTTAITVSGAILNSGAEPSLENLYWCFEEVPSGIHAQVYNTTGSTNWLVEVIQ